MSYPTFDCDCPRGYMNIRYYTNGGIEHSSGTTSSFTTAANLVSVVYLGPKTHMYDAVGNIIAVNYNDWCEEFTPYVRKNSLVFSSPNLEHNVAWRINKVKEQYDPIDIARFKMCADVDNNGFEHFESSSAKSNYEWIILIIIIILIIYLCTTTN